MRNPLRQLETSGVGVLAGVEGCLLWQPATNTLASSTSPRSPECSVAVARGVVAALDAAFGGGGGVCKGGSGGWLSVPTEQITKELATVGEIAGVLDCLLYTSPSPRDLSTSRMPSSA